MKQRLLSLEYSGCGEPAISLHSHHVSLVQWTTRLLPIMRGPGSIPGGVLMWNRDSPVSVVLLHLWPQRDWSLWPHTRPCWQCDNPTWSLTALLSRFPAHCRSSFRLQTDIVGCWGTPVESLQSHCIHTMSQWSSGLPICFPSWGARVQSLGEYLCETGILLLALCRYMVILPECRRFLTSFAAGPQ